MNKTGIIQELNTAHAAFWHIAGQVPETIANTSINGKWSVAQNVAHINKTLEQFGKFISLPPAIIAARFGRSSRPSDVAALLRSYYSAIASGAKATTAYIPDATICYDVHELVATGKASLLHTTIAIDTWLETDLDELNCPHPLLGPITSREMCLFMVHHVSHHQRAIAAAQAAFPAI